ncbi:MAG: hypothetical protein JW860_03160 [Sedimentisphaerales bacterium]|nr:hypothetical protein [Sedimentisphaerales bacterium]
MNKKKIKKVLAQVGIAGLAAGIGLWTAGCNNAKSSCGNGSCNKKAESKEKASCGQGSCGAKHEK